MQPVTVIDASDQPPFDKTWNDFELYPALAEAVRTHKGPGKHLEKVSTIQREIMKAPKDKSIFGTSPTGSGKLVSIIVPPLDEFLKGTAKSALVLAITNPLLDQHVLTLAPIIAKLPKKVYVTKVDSKAAHRIREAARKDPVMLFSTPHQILELSKKDADFARLIASLDYVIIDEVDAVVSDHVFARQVTEVNRMATRSRLLAVTATYTDAALEKVRDMSHRPVLHIIAGKVHKAVIDHRACIVSPGDLLPVLSMLLSHAPNDKVIVFCSTAKFVEFAFQYCVACGVKNCSQLHSRMSDGAKKAATREFQACKQCVLFGSDFTARGMDFEGVTLVVQVGYVPADLYMQRAGRTGRGLVSTGKSMILLTRNETKTLELIKRARGVNIANAICAPERKLKVSLPEKVVSAAYAAYLGAYRTASRTLGWTRPKGQDMVEEINEIIRGAGFKIPVINDKLKRKLGIA